MINLIRFIIGFVVLGFMVYNHQKIIDQINYAMENSEEYESDYDDSDYDDGDYAYDDYDTESDW